MKKNYSGQELGKVLDVSRRTIIRDIDAINYWLGIDNIGFVDNNLGYSLNVNNDYLLESKMKEFQSIQYRLIYQLLINEFETTDELTEQLNLTTKELHDLIDLINDKYNQIFEIKTKVRVGNYLNVSKYKKVDLLSSLIFVKDDVSSTNIDKLSYSQYLNEKQLVSQIDACKSTDYRFNDFSKQKRTIVDDFVKLDLSSLFSEINGNYHINLVNDKFLEELKNHVVRSILFPNYFNEIEKNQFELLRQNNPFEFELSYEIAQNLNNFFDKEVYIDSNYIALYVINNLRINEINKVNIKLIEDKYSIASINQTLLLDNIDNVSVEIVQDSNLENDNADLVVGSSSNLSQVNYDFEYNGILNDVSLREIKKLVQNIEFDKYISLDFSEDNFLNLENNTGDFIEALNDGLDIFCKRKLLSSNDKKKIVSRELEGNQLIVNHISIPHISADIDQQYDILGINMSNELVVDGERVHFILVVMVNQNLNKGSQIFSYLYQKIKNNSNSRINNYNELLELLENKNNGV
ncbi:HTH domain-containing protein [Lactobacillus terrae]|uniref:HTH domain-containing protein n=1 Tax=Lactobacillus terrae TaxID=2269374 RepID=UPI000C1B72A3|nr:HTH domain-containing protein [Lactobacillus terrae]